MPSQGPRSSSNMDTTRRDDSYPDFLYHPGRPSVSTASSSSRNDEQEEDQELPIGSYHDDPNARSPLNLGRNASREPSAATDIDLEDPESLADDVALLQEQRSQARRSVGKAAKYSKPRSTLERALAKLRGAVIIISIVSAAFILIPFIQWLSSSPFASSPLGEAILPLIKNTTLYNYTMGPDFKGGNDPGYKVDNAPAIPEIGTLNGNLPSAFKYGASANTEQGAWGLGRARAAGFQPLFHVPGWADPVSAAAILNTTLDASTVPTSAAPDVKVEPTSISGKIPLRPLTMDDVFSYTFYADRTDLTWSAEDPDEGVFSHVDRATNDIILEDVTHRKVDQTGQGKVAAGGGKVVFVKGDDVKDDNGRKLNWDSFSIAPNMRWVMFFSGRIKQWRHSSHAYVWLHDVLGKQTYKLSAPDEVSSSGPTIAYAKWIPLSNDAPSVQDPNQPDGPALAFVNKNDLYVALTPRSRPIRITNDGAESIFNGVPDWVYEEEVFSSDFALWPSPTGSHLAYLRLDETDVPIYEYPIYNPDFFKSGKTKPYVEKVKMKYPKPGYPNPVVSVHSVDLDELRKHEGRGSGPTWQQVQSAKRNLVSPKTTKLSAEIAASDPHLSVDSINAVDSALTAGPEALHNRLVTEVVWVTPDRVLIKESNRVADKMRTVVFDVDAAKSTSGYSSSDEKEKEVIGEVIRLMNADDMNGWVEPFQTVQPLNPRNTSGSYVDLAPSKDGYRHIALFDSSSTSKPVFLTEGKWEVDKIVFVDAKRNKIYFTAAYPDPSQRHLFETSLTGAQLAKPTPLTDVSKPGFYDASFDPKGAYYTLYELGPGVPTQRVLGVGRDADHKDFELILETNDALRKRLGLYVRPSALYYNIEIESQSGKAGSSSKDDKVLVNIPVREFRPHDFDASGRTRYPVLVFVYGGPNSQSVDATYARPDWHAYLVSTLGYLVITIDARGTGFQGFQHRFSVTGRLGELEAIDVVEAARKISKLAYVDEKRMGIRGWSYGGYLTSKVIERDSGVFGLGMAVAPVSKWEFYDTIYTERYMKTPGLNAQGYESAAVHIGDGFRHADYFLASGSADDNVHPTNIYHLLDQLTAERIHRYEFRHFEDSDHSISTRGAFRELHEFMTAFLQRRWGAGGRRKAVPLPPRTLS
ncbi:Dipeptidyl peptidase 4 [Tilletia horrida]|nr:Dipeptidyl peptidase 4 [Tilletia horrida]